MIALPNLLAAFEAGFEGVGDREHTYVYAAKSGEFFAHDRRWDLAMHTFQRKEQIDPSVLLERMCQSAVYLRSKFFADLASADLTFVFRSNDVSESDAITLQRAMQRHGAGRLMVVRPIRPGEIPCELRVLDRHCYYGLTSRRGDDPDAQTWDIPFKDWLVLCRQAASLNDPRTAIARC